MDLRPTDEQQQLVAAFSSLYTRAADMVELVGPDALRSGGDPTAVSGGQVEHILRHAKCTTIYAGLSEIQRNIIAQHGLGLPRPS